MTCVEATDMLRLSILIKRITFTNAGNVIRKENFMYTKIMLITAIAILTSSCTEFAILASGSSLAISQNTYAKAYNAIDMGVVITTKKGIKQHAYEKGKKYIVDYGRAKALGIMSKH